MKKSKKNVIFIILTFFAIIFAPIKSKAGIEKINNNFNSYIVKTSSIEDLTSYNPKPVTGGETQIVTNKFAPIIGTIITIGIILCVVALAIIGVKYMLGSVEQKAEYKKTMIPFLIGIFMIVGITTIIGIVSKIMSGIFA